MKKVLGGFLLGIASMIFVLVKVWKKLIRLKAFKEICTETLRDFLDRLFLGDIRSKIHIHTSYRKPYVSYSTYYSTDYPRQLYFECRTKENAEKIINVLKETAQKYNSVTIKELKTLLMKYDQVASSENYKDTERGWYLADISDFKITKRNNYYILETPVWRNLYE